MLPPNLPQRAQEVKRPPVSPYEATSATLFVEIAWGLVEGERGRPKGRLAAEKNGVYGFENNHRGAIPSLLVSMSRAPGYLGCVKKAETGEEEEEGGVVLVRGRERIRGESTRRPRAASHRQARSVFPGQRNSGTGRA